MVAERRWAWSSLASGPPSPMNVSRAHASISGAESVRSAEKALSESGGVGRAKMQKAPRPLARAVAAPMRAVVVWHPAAMRRPGVPQSTSFRHSLIRWQHGRLAPAVARLRVGAHVEASVGPGEHVGGGGASRLASDAGALGQRAIQSGVVGGGGQGRRGKRAARLRYGCKIRLEFRTRVPQPPGLALGLDPRAAVGRVELRRGAVRARRGRAVHRAAAPARAARSARRSAARPGRAGSRVRCG